MIQRYEAILLDGIIDLFVTVFNAPPWNDAWTKEAAQEYVSRIIHDSYFSGICCIENDEVAGFLFGVYEYWYTGETFHIKELCVSPNVRNKGYGSEMLRALEDELRSKKARSIFLLTERNSDAEKFYMKNGYYKNEKLGAMGKKL